MNLPFLLAASQILAASPSPEAAPPAGRPPNIVLLLADDLGRECVNVYGGESYRTPHIDRLAQNGMRFNHAFSSPLCTPSRVQLMTGLYNVRNYVKFGELRAGETTFANILRNAGYATAMAGKWQLAGGPEAPRDFGFDEYLLWQHTRKRTKPGQPNDSRYPNPNFELNGKPVDYRNGEYGPDVLAGFLEDFITKNKDRPFLAYYSMLLPHCPFEATPNSAEWDPKSEGSPTYEGDPRFFADMVAYTDKQVGRFVAKLEELGLRENTIVIFLADNGTDKTLTSRWNGTDFPGGKARLRDAGIRVPFVVSWPGHIPAGSVNDEIVDFSDFLPTFCQLADAPLPKDYAGDGVSLVPSLLGQPGRKKPWTYLWYGDGVMARDLHFMVRGPQNGSKFEFFALPAPYQEELIRPKQMTPEQSAKRDELLGVIERLAKTRPANAPTSQKESSQ